MSEEQYVSDTAKKSIHAKVEHIGQQHLNSASPVYWTEKECAKAIRSDLLTLALILTVVIALSCLPFRGASGAGGAAGRPIIQIVKTSIIRRRVRRGEKIIKSQTLPAAMMVQTAKAFALLFGFGTVILGGFALAVFLPVLFAPHGLASFLSAAYLLMMSVVGCVMSARLALSGLHASRNNGPVGQQIFTAAFLSEEPTVQTPSHWWTNNAARDETKQPLGRQ